MILDLLNNAEHRKIAEMWTMMRLPVEHCTNPQSERWIPWFYEDPEDPVYTAESFLPSYAKGAYTCHLMRLKR